MAKIDSSKLLPSSKESSAIVKVDKPSVDIKEKKVNLASSLKPIDLKSSALSRDVVKDKKVDDAKDANNKLVKIEKFFKSDLLVSRKKAEEKRKEKEKQDFGEAEKKLEFPKLKGFQLPKLPSLPTLGIFERIKRFLFFTAIGWLLPKIIEFMPKLNGIIKVIGNVYQFAEGLFGKLFDGFMSLVKFGGDLKDKTIGFIANTRVGSSGNFQKEFDKLEKLFNTFTDAAIIAGLLAVDIGAAAFDEYNKWNRKNRPKPGKPTKPKEPRKPGKPPVTTGRGGQKGLGKGKKVKVTGGKKPSWWKGFIPKFKLPSWMEKIASRLQGGPFKKLAGPFKKFLGAAIPFAGSAIGELDARSRFASGDNVGGWLARTSAILDGFAGTTAVIGAGFLSSIIGTPVAAFLGAASGIATGISMAIDALLLVRDILNGFNIKTFSQGGKIFRKYQGGGTATRGGKPINAPKRRTITPTKRKPFKIKSPKSKPGKDVGGEDRIKNLYPDTGSKKPAASLQQWLAMGYAGTYQQYLDEIKRREGSNGSNDKKPNSYKALTSTAKILKEIPLIGGIMGAAVDVALGQKIDYKIIKSLSSGIGYLVESLANQRINLSVASLNREISSFSDGGYVSPSRELKKNYDSLSSGDLISKVIGPSIEQRVNEAIQSIQKELQKQRIETGGAGGRSPGGVPGDPGGDNLDVIGGGMVTGGNADFWALAAIAALENDDPQGQADVAQAIYNRVAAGKSGVRFGQRSNTILSHIIAPGQFQPVRDTGNHLGMRDDQAYALWGAIRDKETAIQAVSKHINGGRNAARMVESASRNITNTKLIERARSFIGGRTDFSATNRYRPRPGAHSIIRRAGHDFGFFVGPGSIQYGRTNPPPAVVPSLGNVTVMPAVNIPRPGKLPPLPPTGRISGQNYGAFRRKYSGGHTGQDYDISGNEKFYSRLGGEVVYVGAGYGKEYGNIVEIYNKDLGVTEVIAEALHIMPGIRKGMVVAAGTPVVYGERPETPGIGSYGVIHYEIVKGRGGITRGSRREVQDPRKFLNSKRYRDYISSSRTESTQQLLGQQPSKPVENLSTTSVVEAQRKVNTLRNPGQRVNFPGIGYVIVEKNKSGTSVKKFYLYDSKGKSIEVEPSEFFRSIKEGRSTRGQSSRPGTQPPRPGAQASRPPKTSLVNIIRALLGKGTQSFKFNGETYYFDVRTSTGRPEDAKPYVWKPGIIPTQYDISGNTNLGLKQALIEKIRSMYKFEKGGLITPSTSRLPILNSFASYEHPDSRMMIAIQPVIIEKQIPVSSGSKTIAFPVAISVNSNMNNLSLSRG